jgi:hypothetical protein
LAPQRTLESIARRRRIARASLGPVTRAQATETTIPMTLLSSRQGAEAASGARSSGGVFDADAE